jgi:hypothetical protein
LLDLIAESRLGDMQFTAGANKTSGTDDRHEISQLTQIQLCLPVPLVIHRLVGS